MQSHRGLQLVAELPQSLKKQQAARPSRRLVDQPRGRRRLERAWKEICEREGHTVGNAVFNVGFGSFAEVCAVPELVRFVPISRRGERLCCSGATRPKNWGMSAFQALALVTGCVTL
jgi:hypothetical protein